MAFPTLMELRRRAQDRCDMTAGTTAFPNNTPFVSDTEWNEYLNECGSELYDIILRSDETALVTTVSIPITSAQSVYQLPQDFYKMNAAFEQTSLSSLLPLSRMGVHDLALDSDWPYFYSRNNRSSGYRYYLENLSIELRPIPTGTFNLVLKYVPQFKRFVDDASIAGWPTVNGWEEYLIVGAAIKALLKEGSVGQAQGLMAERKSLRDRILEMASGKDQFSARQIRDVYGTTYSYGARRVYLPNR